MTTSQVNGAALNERGSDFGFRFQDIPVCNDQGRIFADRDRTETGVDIDIARGKAEAAQARVEEFTNRDASLKSERKALTQRRDALKMQLTLLLKKLLLKYA